MTDTAASLAGAGAGQDPRVCATGELADRSLPGGQVPLSGRSGWPFLLPLGLLVAVFGLATLRPVLLAGGLLASLVPIAGWFLDANRELAAVAGGSGEGAAVAGGSGEGAPGGHLQAPGHLHDGRAAFPGPALGLLIALVVVAVGITLSLEVRGSTGQASGGSGGQVASAANGPAAVAAKNLQFSVGEIDAPAGKAFQIAFQNDDALPHNIAIVDQGGSTALFRGDIVTGPTTTTYEVPALPAGRYTFHCDVHPGMSGTVSVR